MPLQTRSQSNRASKDDSDRRDSESEKEMSRGSPLALSARTTTDARTMDTSNKENVHEKAQFHPPQTQQNVSATPSSKKILEPKSGGGRKRQGSSLSTPDIFSPPMPSSSGRRPRPEEGTSRELETEMSRARDGRQESARSSSDRRSSEWNHRSDESRYRRGQQPYSGYRESSRRSEERLHRSPYYQEHVGEGVHSHRTHYGSHMNERQRDSHERRHNPRQSRGPGGHQHRHHPGGISRELPSGNIAAELDLAAKEDHDDFGPTVADCHNLGSFADDSPTRDAMRYEDERSRMQSIRRGDRFLSDPPSRGLSKSSSSHPPPYASPFPRSGQPPPYGSQTQGPYMHPSPHGPPPPYYHGPPPQASPSHYYPGSGHRGYPESPYPSYSAPSREEHWYGEPQRSNCAEEDRNKERSQESKESTPSPPPAKKRRGEGSWEGEAGSVPPDPETSSTPSKLSKSNSGDEIAGESLLGVPSPYRSPKPNIDKETGRTASSKKAKRTPLFGDTIGFSASFGMDTPGGPLDSARLDEFSPMGPFLDGPLPGQGANINPEDVADSGIQFDSKLTLSKSSSNDSGNGEGPKHPMIRQRWGGGDDATSPFDPSFMRDLSPAPGSSHRQGSPYRNDDREFDSYHGGGYGGYPFASPQGPISDRYRERHPHGPVGPGRDAHATPKGSLLTSPVASSSGNVQREEKNWPDPDSGPFRLQLGNVGLRQDSRRGLDSINSAMRGGAMMTYGRGPRYDNHGRMHSGFRNDLRTPIKVGTSGTAMPGYPGSHNRGQTPLSASNRSRYPPGIPGSISTPGKPLATGKENHTPKHQKRNPCNCKKSKCLKLYCECFGSLRFCEGCNCQDCNNTHEFEAIRAKSIKEILRKNKDAFKPKIAVKPVINASVAPSASGHNMGCKCKKSACLKKYCECFEASVMCGSKCKCVECMNFVGSQALIDRRRKIKDHRGAELAMRSADDAWKGKSTRKPGTMSQHVTPSPGPAHQMAMAPMMKPSPPGHRGLNPYMAPMMMGPPQMGYSPMGMPPRTQGYGSVGRPMHHHTSATSGTRTSRPPESSKKAPLVMATPKTPAVRLAFDPQSSKKKRKLAPGSKEPTEPFFGPDVPEQPKTTALTIFSFLSNEDLYNSCIVCKKWTKLSLDKELWQY